MKLNLGCGNTHLPRAEGWINVDQEAASHPDQIWNLERFPWPWADNSADEILLSHVLEHLGAEVPTYLAIIKELYRVAKPDGRVVIVVPHPRHDNFAADPTHVRPITPAGLELFSQKINLEWKKGGYSNTPLGIYQAVDFVIAGVEQRLSEPWRSQLAAGLITRDALQRNATLYNNVVEQFTIVLKAVKPSTVEREAAVRKAG